LAPATMARPQGCGRQQAPPLLSVRKAVRIDSTLFEPAILGDYVNNEGARSSL
jgi:hypothetical protein